MRGTALTVVACCVVAGCAFGSRKAPVGKRPTPRTFTAEPDPSARCACPITPKTLRFTTVASVGLCGGGTAGTGPTPALSCGTLYIGGGAPSARSGSLPGADAVFRASACSGDTVFLKGANRKETGRAGACTAKGCPFAAPTPFPDAASPPASTCVVLKVADEPVGEVNCVSGDAGIRVPLAAEIYLTGDLLPKVAGIQPCPICTGPVGRRTCKGGARHGKRCVPSGAPDETASADCPPGARDHAGTISLPLVLDTQSQTAMASALPRPSTQARVFCGFCRDVDGAGTFQGSAASAHPCLTSRDCAQPFEACEQRTSGAFGRGDMTGLTASGAPAPGIGDGKPHPATLVSMFCAPPTFDATLDASFDLPGPGAVALPGMLQLQ